MWLKFGNSSISIREVIVTSILEEFDEKNQFPLHFIPVWQKGQN